MEDYVCHDCKTRPGELHQPGCDMEECPFCLEQLIGCDCCYEHLGLFDKEKYGPDTVFLPPEIYKNGLTEEQDKKWIQILDQKGRIPYKSETRFNRARSKKP